MSYMSLKNIIIKMINFYNTVIKLLNYKKKMNKIRIGIVLNPHL